MKRPIVTKTHNPGMETIVKWNVEENKFIKTKLEDGTVLEYIAVPIDENDNHNINTFMTLDSYNEDAPEFLKNWNFFEPVDLALSRDTYYRFIVGESDNPGKEKEKQYYDQFQKNYKEWADSLPQEEE